MRTAGTAAYAEADCDLAVACFLLARVWKETGRSEAALTLLEEAQDVFETIARDSGDENKTKLAEGMASACLTERGDCLCDLGRIDATADAYQERIKSAEEQGDEHGVAVEKFQLGTVRLLQHHYPEALSLYEATCEQSDRLGKPGTIAETWHRIVWVH